MAPPAIDLFFLNLTISTGLEIWCGKNQESHQSQCLHPVDVQSRRLRPVSPATVAAV